MRRLVFLPLPLALLLACGSRTGLNVEVPEDELASDAGPSSDGSPPACRGEPWLLFELTDDTTGGLYAMRADGSQGHALNVPMQGGYASLSGDGTKLFYVTFTPEAADAGYLGTLFMQDLRSGTTTTLLSDPAGSFTTTYTALSYSALSPDGRTLAYTIGYDVHAFDMGTMNDRVLLQGSLANLIVYGHPSFTPGSDTVLFGTSDAFGSIGVDGSDMETLVAEDGIGPIYPNVALSPDGSSVASVIGCAGLDAGLVDTTLRVYPVASLPAACESGTVVTELDDTYSSPNGCPNPSWGPSGLIAYSSGTDVYVVDPDGGAPRNMTAELTADAGAAFDPIWAPACAPIP
jgi:Tol biopolymer transport system component